MNETSFGISLTLLLAGFDALTYEGDFGPQAIRMSTKKELAQSQCAGSHDLKCKEHEHVSII